MSFTDFIVGITISAMTESEKFFAFWLLLNISPRLWQKFIMHVYFSHINDNNYRQQCDYMLRLSPIVFDEHIWRAVCSRHISMDTNEAILDQFGHWCNPITEVEDYDENLLDILINDDVDRIMCSQYETSYTLKSAARLAAPKCFKYLWMSTDHSEVSLADAIYGQNLEIINVIRTSEDVTFECFQTALDICNFDLIEWTYTQYGVSDEDLEMAVEKCLGRFKLL